MGLDNGIVELIAPTYKDLYYISGMTNLVAKTVGGYVVVDKTGAEISTHVDSSYDLKYETLEDTLMLLEKIKLIMYLIIKVKN